MNKIINEPKKLIVIVGPTASGKTDLAVKLALKLDSGQAEVISAHSRQIYKGMNIGTGKITTKEMQGIPHHLLNIVSPKNQFTVAKYKNLAENAINQRNKKEKNSDIVGGTGFYIQAITDGIIIPPVKPDWKLRKKLEKKTKEHFSNNSKNSTQIEQKLLMPKTNED